MNTQDSGYCSEDYQKLYQCAEMAAKDENYYLMYTTFISGGFQIGCGLSPARTFSPVIVMQEPLKPKKLSFSAQEWSSLMYIMDEKLSSFFYETLDQFPDEYDSVKIPCGDFCMVTQHVFDDTKFIEVFKHDTYFYLTLEDVLQILEIHRCLISHRVSMLDNLEFCAYYYNIVDKVTEQWKYNGDLSKLKLLYSFCESSTEDILSNILREYIYFYKCRVRKDLNDL